MNDKNVKYEFHPHNDVDRIRQKFQKDGLPSGGGGSGEAGYTVKNSRTVILENDTGTVIGSDNFIGFESNIPDDLPDYIILDGVLDASVVDAGLITFDNTKFSYFVMDNGLSLYTAVVADVQFLIGFGDMNGHSLVMFGTESSLLEEGMSLTVNSLYYDDTTVEVTDDFALARGYSIKPSNQEIPEQTYNLDTTEVLLENVTIDLAYKGPLDITINGTLYKNVDYDYNEEAWIADPNDPVYIYIYTVDEECFAMYYEGNAEITISATVPDIVSTTDDFKVAVETISPPNVLIVNDVEGVLDKTLGEIRDAISSGMFVYIPLFGIAFETVYESEAFSIHVFALGDSPGVITYSASGPNEYPAINNDEEEDH